MNIPQIDLPVYDAIARRDLQVGCFIEYNEEGDKYIVVISEPPYSDEEKGIYRFFPQTEYGWTDWVDIDKDDFKVIGHEILLSDVLNFLYKKDEEDSGYQFTLIVEMWNYPFPYYSQQSEETKAFIRSLI